MATSYSNIIVVITTSLVAGLLSSCNNHRDKQAKPVRDSVITISKNLTVADSLQLVHDIDSADYVYLFKNQVNIWISKALNDSNLRWTDFTLADFNQYDSIRQSDDQPGKELLSDYSIFLRWSPDSTYLLDFGSYGVTMAKDKNGQLYIQSGDVDSEIRLFNIKKKTSGRLMFHGPSTSTWDARWANNEQVALLGIDKSESMEHPDTLLWLINVKDNFLRKYKYNRH